MVRLQPLWLTSLHLVEVEEADAPGLDVADAGPADGQEAGNNPDLAALQPVNAASAADVVGIGDGYAEAEGTGMEDNAQGADDVLEAIRPEDDEEPDRQEVLESLALQTILYFTFVLIFQMLASSLRAKQEWLKTAPPKPKKGGDKAEKKGDKAEKKADVALAEGEIVYADEMQKHLTSILHGMLAAAPADPYKEMYKGCFAASLLEGGGEVAASTMTLTPEHEAYIKKFSLQTHIDTCIAKKAKGTGPKGPFKFMMSDASDFFTDLSKKLKAQGGVPADATMTAEELAAKDKADAEARRLKEAAAEAERDRIDAENAKRTAEMEASGKKVTGGLHKFDASEVDINGGNATADDFMDAFGF